MLKYPGTILEYLGYDARVPGMILEYLGYDARVYWYDIRVSRIPC